MLYEVKNIVTRYKNAMQRNSRMDRVYYPCVALSCNKSMRRQHTCATYCVRLINVSNGYSADTRLSMVLKI